MSVLRVTMRHVVMIMSSGCVGVRVWFSSRALALVHRMVLEGEGQASKVLMVHRPRKRKITENK